MNLSQIKVGYVVSFMALSIQIPTFSSNIADSELSIRLIQFVMPNIIHYVISFIVVGMYWISYHRIFELLISLSYG